MATSSICAFAKRVMYRRGSNWLCWVETEWKSSNSVLVCLKN